MAFKPRNPEAGNRLFRILTFGCKVNQCDTTGLAQELTARGWRAAPPGPAPDLVLVNTCTVTARADQQARQAIRRLAREHPGAAILVTGCYAQRAPGELAALPGVRLVLGNREKSGLADYLAALPLLSPLPPGGERIVVGEGPEETGGAGSNNARKEKIRVGPLSPGGGFRPWPVPAFPGHTRPRLKVQDGCGHACAYCIVPQVRGPECSLPPGEVAGALEELAGCGYRETVLTGVNLGRYGRDLTPPTDLAALLRRVRSRPRPPRLRLSSLEPQDVPLALLEELAAFPGFCPHFHLPLQSGAAPVLAAMGRDYTPGGFQDLVREIQRRFPGAALGLDVLVGFPGETGSDFEATRALVESLPVTYLHVFPFSPRPGTPAAAMPRVAAREVQARARIMRDLGQVKKMRFIEAQIGRTGEVLVETPAPQGGWLRGLSGHYLRVLLPGPLSLRNQIVTVRFRQVRGESLIGEPR
jgi:threonylcarbamoyladenosine tRNA methylthiotransferase MtaB